MPSAAGAAERGACMMAAFATIVREPALSRKRMDEWANAVIITLKNGATTIAHWRKSVSATINMLPIAGIIIRKAARFTNFGRRTANGKAWLSVLRIFGTVCMQRWNYGNIQMWTLRPIVQSDVIKNKKLPKESSFGSFLSACQRTPVLVMRELAF